MSSTHVFSAPSRRRFLQTLGLGAGALMLPSLGTRLSAAGETTTPDGRRPLGVALVGLGRYSRNELAPALKATQWCRLAGIVTGSPDKIPEWQKTYDIPESCVYNYENFDRIADNPAIDIIYIVVPNGLHAAFAIRAARAGKHVIVEKPMAVTVEECDQIIKACDDAKVRLSIGYRLHFEPHNLELMRLSRTKEFGAVRRVVADDGYVSPGGTWRHDPKLAGGPLMDLGVYCVQAGCNGTGEDPIAVTAREEKTDLTRFAHVEETMFWTMEFPSGAKAECMMSYNQRASLQRVEAENGWYELAPGYSYRGITGKTSRGPLTFPEVNQQALQMDGFARCILDGTPTIVPAAMGRRDVKIMRAIYEAARTGKRVTV